MRAGDLTTYGQIKYPAITRSATGAEVKTFTTMYSGWFKKESISGREYLAAGGEHSEVTAKFTGYFNAGVRASMKIYEGNRVFDIMAILPNGMWMVLMCREVV